MSINRDIKVIEAVLFASTEPILENDLKDKVINKEEFNSYMSQIKLFYENRGINLIKTGMKW